MTDKEYITGIINKDENTFRNFVHTFQKKVIHTCYSFVHNMQDAEDIAQEVFIEIYKSIKKFKSNSTLSTWLYRISVNKSLNYIRDNKKIRNNTFSYDNLGFNQRTITGYSVNSASDYFESEENKILKNIVFSVVDKLPENQKTAFLLNKYEELSYKDIAEIMELSNSSVESLIFRAKQNLKKELFHFQNKYNKTQEIT